MTAPPAARAVALFGAAASTVASSLVTGCAAQDAAATPRVSTARPAAARGDLTVTAPFIPKPVDKEMAAAYFTVRNAGSVADHLDRVTAPGFAREVQTHATKNDRMITVRGYDVPAHGSLTLSRGGNHLMLTKLSRMPRVGQTVTLRLYFAKAGRVDVPAPVKAATYRPTNSGPGMGGTMHEGGEHGEG